MTQAILKKLRAFSLSLPEAVEVPAWGHPNFRAGKKTFAVYEVYQERPCVVVKAARPDAEILLDDARFFRPPYVGKHGWVGVWVDRPVRWPLLRSLVLDSYRAVALKRMLAELDGGGARATPRLRKKA